MVAGSVTAVCEPVEVPDQLRSPVPEPVTSMLPVAVPQSAGFVTIPAEMTGAGLAVTVIPVETGDVQPLAVCETV